MYIPSSTYRVQLHKNFTFKDLYGIIDYLHLLGVSTIYAAPILKSTPGSIHGYDVTDPHVIDQEIGTRKDLQAIAIKLKQKGMTWLQDIVPNHMAFDPSNHRLMDVLERGPASVYYNYFDIQWDHPSAALKHKVMVPFLGAALEECIKDKELKLLFTDSGFEISYYNTNYPVSSIAYDYLFSLLDSPEASILRKDWAEFIRGRAFASDIKTWSKLKINWIEAISARDQDAFRDMVNQVNSSYEKMLDMLSRQHYILTYWKHTEKEINYRRFFTINQLICLKMEDENVFKEYHSFLFSLYKENLIQGFRIDHIDGLKDPAQYVKNLRKLFGENCYIIAEKILEVKEIMPLDWPLQGTSGYEFLAYVSQLFTDKNGARQLLEFYRTLVPELPAYSQLVVKNKKMMLENYMGGEWGNLVHYLFELELHGNFEYAKLKQALGLLMISLPVYRIYPEQIPLYGNDLEIMNEAFGKALKLESACVNELKYLQTLFLASEDQELKYKILEFLKRLMQFTGPLTAKGVEDTTFYIYNPLISHDEVGDSPSILGITIQEFHRRMESRLQYTPHSLNTTATHDTKRGEDVRVRLNVLSEIPARWKEAVTNWISMNKNISLQIGSEAGPTMNDAYFIYQSIVGGFPEDLVVADTWVKRLQEYVIKVVREAKVRSNWELPNEHYENACTQFIDHLLKDETEFLPSAIALTQKILEIANVYTLGQVLVKITAPGIPDIYQGCELWDLSYVDPDNRRPVDFSLRKKLLEGIIREEKKSVENLFTYHSAHRSTGIEKLFVTWKSLIFRRNHIDIFRKGNYIPLNEKGNKQIASVYARNYENQWIIVAVPFGIAGQMKDHVLELDEKDTITLPLQFPDQWTNLFTGKTITSKGFLSLREMFSDFPVVLLYNI
jgi:(1->4)-alpha-D-glucan 1-alpha-D-glucosylmutase